MSIMAKRSRSGVGVDADEEEERETSSAPPRRRCQCGGSTHDESSPFSRLGDDVVLEIAARLPSPSAARALAFASADLYSVVRPALLLVAFLARYLLSTGSKTRRYGPAAPDTMFVRGPRSLLTSEDPQRRRPGSVPRLPHHLKRRGAYVAASCGRRLLCAHGADARYSVVDPAADLWIALPPPPVTSQDDKAYLESAARLPLHGGHERLHGGLPDPATQRESSG